MSHGVKRKHAVSETASRKKHKIESVKNDQPRPVVRADALAWHEISLNQHLEDAEGFFGLEEIDDVEVIKDEKGKSVLFRPSRNDDVKQDFNGHEDGDAEEWSGFDDGDDGSVENATDVDETPKHNGQGLIGTTDDADVLSDVDFVLLNGTTSEAELDMSAWSDVELSSDMLSALSHMGFSAPTKIQTAAIPEILGGRDVIGKAVTGSGKTLAFGIPIVEKFIDQNKSLTESGCLALILAPTRELAHQISKHLAGLCETLSRRPRITTVTGGLSVLKQQRQLVNANIVVGTPGRLWEVISGSSEVLAKFRQLHFLVVDEADRLLTEGHFKEVEDILEALDKVTIEDEDETESSEHEHEHASTRQTLVFSATFHKGLQQKLASKRKDRKKNSDLLSDKQSMEYLMHKLPFQDGQKPTYVDASPDSQLAEKLIETILECGAMQKDLYLYTYLLQEQHKRRLASNTIGGSVGISRILVFTNSVSAVKRLVPFLQTLALPHTTVAPLQSNMPQKARLRSLERFSDTPTGSSQPTTTILVATDVAARGLDISGITTIIHYHVPRTADTYVHRSGRTARINNAGRSILLCSPEEIASVTKLIAQLHARTDKPINDIGNVLDRMYLSTQLIKQVEKRVDLAQKIIDASQTTDKVNSQDHWLRKAAEDLGVDYDSEEFEAAGRQHRRGRGGGKERQQKQAVAAHGKNNKTNEWRAMLKDALQQRLDFGDGTRGNMKYLAGGSLDVDRLLAERVSR